ncbi:MAG: ABC transporter permease [Roseburia sp.]|nr:ABC transporter permease [Roseburia sp.]
MAQVWEYIKIALMNIKSNKGRSILTMLGIIIGISSVIMIISIGNGMKRDINSELNNMAGGQLYIYSMQENEEGEYLEFSDEDLELIQEKVPHVKAVTSMESYSGTATGRKGMVNASINFGTTGLEYSSNDPIIKGRYFTENDYYSGNLVCVITESSARALFGSTNVIDMSFEVNMWGMVEEYTIVGIRQDSAASLLTMGYDEVGFVNMEAPKSVLDNVYGFYPGIYQMLIVSEGAEYSTQVAKNTLQILENKYDARGKNLIGVQNFADIMGEMNTVLNTVTIFIVFVAAISLLVGGIGVMNIMLVSVTERTREIGIRKSLGARTGSITLQFLSESAIITLMGGLIGILLGELGASGICALMGVNAYVSLGTVLGASFFSSAVGIFFGIYPARKAAKLSPIEALRHE